MRKEYDFLYQPRHHREIEEWKQVTDEEWYDPLWQRRNSIRSVARLKQVIRLTPHQEKEIERTIRTMRSQGKEPMRITPYYSLLMHRDPFHLPVTTGAEANRIDPVFWQSVPTPANLMFPDAGKEASMDEGSRSYGAVYQRYPNRVALFVAENTSCASYCVHCQRAKSLDTSATINTKEIDKGLFYIGYNRNINEVLVTGGDALMISHGRLRYVLEELSRIPHLRVIRIATRVPVVLPMAITGELLSLIKVAANRHTTGVPKYVYFMTHINHYQEITADLAAAALRILEHGFTIRNQTVLLNHVNDNFRILAETFRRMFWIGIHPYYLLQCHKERGIAHFITPIQVGKIFMKHLQGWISGVTVPRYAVNVEGGGGKVLLMPSGHDTLNTGNSIDEKISESYATVSTWDHRKILHYEALGRATRDEYEEAVATMDAFIGRPGVFLPRVILVDEKGNHLETTNRTCLPVFEKSRKSALLGYELEGKEMPVTNPALLACRLDKAFERSSFCKTRSAPHS